MVSKTLVTYHLNKFLKIKIQTEIFSEKEWIFNKKQLQKYKKKLIKYDL
jgi:hypothetical protein